MRGLVGLLFEICIVDASIYSTRMIGFWFFRGLFCGGVGVGECGVLLEQFKESAPGVWHVLRYLGTGYLGTGYVVVMGVDES